MADKDKILITKVDDNDVYYDWQEWVYLDEVEKDLIIIGDRKYVMFGDATLADVVNGDYYDDDTIDVPTEDGFLESETIAYDYETLEELEKLTGKKWQRGELRGYSQGDWCEIYYTDKVDEAMINGLETWIMGKVSEYKIQEPGDEDGYYNFIPHDVEWKGHKEVCEYFGFDLKDCIVKNDDDE